MDRSESSHTYGRNDTTGDRQKNLPGVIASETARFGESSTADRTNRSAFRPSGQRNRQGISCGTLSREARRADWKVSPEFSGGEYSKPEDGASSGPTIAAVEGGFHTHYVLFTKNNVASVSAAAKSAFLLKVESNCCWDGIRRRILENILKQCPDNTFYPPVEQLRIGGFLVDILPKAEYPEVLPPDVQMKMMSPALHAIGVRVTVDHHHSALNSSPLSAPLATGLSAFSQLRLKFPSQPASRHIKSSHEGSTARPTSCTLGPFPRRSVNTALSSLTETVTQPQTVNVGSSGRLRTAKFTCSARPKPAILCSSSSLANSSAGSARVNSTTACVSRSKLPLSNGTEFAGQRRGTSMKSPVTDGGVSDMQSFTSRVGANKSLSEIPSSTPSLSAFSSLLSTDSSNSRVKLNSPTLSTREREWTKLGERARDSVGSSRTSKAVAGSFMSRNIGASLGLNDDDVIVVEDDDDSSPNTSSCQLSVTDAGAAVSAVQSSSAELSSGVPSHLSVSHSTMQIVSLHDSSASLVQSVTDVPVPSQAVVHPASGAVVSGNGPSTVPVASVNSSIGNSQTTTQLATTTGSSPGCECSAVELESVTEDRQHSLAVADSARPDSTGLLLTDEDSFVPQLPADTGPDTAQPVVNQAHGGDSSSRGKEDAAEINSTAEQKQVDTSPRNDDLECQPVASSSAEVLTGSEDDLSLLFVELVQSASTSAVDDQQQQSLNAAPVYEHVSALPDDSDEIVPLDEEEVRSKKVKK